MHQPRLPVLAAALLALAAGSCAGVRGTSLPAAIESCETHTATLCATWRLEGSRYVADWDQGSHAEIRVGKWSDEDVVLIRDDPSGTSKGMHAVYVGSPRGGRVIEQGIVTWSHKGQRFSGRWTARW